MRMQPSKPLGSVRRKSRMAVEPLDDKRRDLAAKYVPLALSIARKFSVNWSWMKDEMESAALVALVEAARTFDPDRNVKFSTFLRKRLFGALLDTRRQMCQSFARVEAADSDDEEFGWLKTKPLSNLRPEEVIDYEGRLVDPSSMREDGPLYEVHDFLRTEFRILPSRHREVMDGLYLRHQSYEELSVSLNCSKSRLIAVHRESIDLLIENRRNPPIDVRRTRQRRQARTGFSAKTEPNRETL